MEIVSVVSIVIIVMDGQLMAMVNSLALRKMRVLEGDGRDILT